MKEHLLEILEKEKRESNKLNIMREYLQAYILKILHENKFFNNAAFLGGTALRFVYDLPRYSEDLDFSSIERHTNYLEDNVKILKRELSLAGYDMSFSSDFSKTVQYSFVKFEGLKYEAGLSPHRKEKLSIKLDLDTNPPAGAEIERKVKNKFFLLGFNIYNFPSLFAGKLHALLFRTYTKGRDWYDLLWYLTGEEKLRPNFVLLNNAIKQTDEHHKQVTEKNWKKTLKKRIDKCDFKKVRDEVNKFLERPEEAEFLTGKNFYKLLDKY
ncbi:MAG: nucleotidyl transferase AbiEii/AbiGii toxin family protein [Elusimicrobiota bacterium]